MRKYLLFIGFGILVSCELFMSKEEQMQKQVDEQLLEVEWNEVDSYPFFEEECDESAPKEIQRDCFQTVLLSYFSQALDSLEFQVEKDMNETIYVDFKIDQHGFILVTNVEENGNILSEIEDFDKLITERLNDLTTVKPAIKRGIEVGLRCRLPIVLNTN